MWFKWLLVVLFSLESIVTILCIGDHRKPRTVQDALLGIVVGALLIWGLLANWGTCS